jgi:hypothetical protein
MFDRSSKKEVTLEASRDVAKPKTMLKPRKVKDGGFFVINLVSNVNLMYLTFSKPIVDF